MRLGLKIGIILIILFISGCSQTAREKILRVFFDGVPVEGEIEREKRGKIIAESLTEYEQSAKSARTEKPFKAQETEPVFRHFPYAERQCDVCHVSNFSQGLSAEGKELCFTCHDDFLEEMEIKHFPAEEGMCLDCHHPHQSKNKKLLLKTGRLLCFDCHDQDEILTTEPHDEIGQEDCISCHNPHGE